MAKLSCNFKLFVSELQNVHLSIFSEDDDDDEMNNNVRSNGMPPMITADHTTRAIPAEG